MNIGAGKAIITATWGEPTYPLIIPRRAFYESLPEFGQYINGHLSSR